MKRLRRTVLATLLLGVVAYAAHAEAKAKQPPTNAEINALHFATFDGKPTTLGTVRAPGVTFIDVWNESCAPCLAELPLLQKLADSYKDDPSVKVVTIAFGLGDDKSTTPTEKSLEAWKQSGITIPTLWDARMKFMRLMKGSDIGLPLTLVVDKNGHVIEHQGLSYEMSEAEFVAHERKLIESMRSAP